MCVNACVCICVCVHVRECVCVSKRVCELFVCFDMKINDKGSVILTFELLWRRVKMIFLKISLCDTANQPRNLRKSYRPKYKVLIKLNPKVSEENIHTLNK